MEAENELILCQRDSTIMLEVRLDNDSVWLNRNQIAQLFDRDVKTIGKHIANALNEELEDMPTVANFATVQIEGNRTVTRNIEYYNLDVIISVGYRVKSKRGIQFRAWANKVLKNYLLRGYSINQRLLNMERRIDDRLLDHDKRLDYLTEKVDFLVRTSVPPIEGIFFEDRIFDAYALVCDLIQSAKNRIVLIDNYADYSVLQQLDKRAAGVSALIYTSDKNETIKNDLKRHNKQYPPIELKIYKKSHDRFLIIDNTIYHIGASLKDLGKKLFAFSRIEEMTADELLSRITSKA